MSKQVVVCDYGIGNVFSICNALSRVGASPLLTGDPAIVRKAERVILPGVGAFPRAMQNLRALGLDDAIATFIETERPFLGICIGMQVLMERSIECGEHCGLGHIEGAVGRIPSFSINGGRIRAPFIGWSKVDTSFSSRYDILFDLADCERYFYFVHSYMCNPTSDENLIATTNIQGNKMVAAVGRDNILGVQFHPERSGTGGLMFLSRFVSLV